MSNKVSHKMIHHPFTRQFRQLTTHHVQLLLPFKQFQLLLGACHAQFFLNRREFKRHDGVFPVVEGFGYQCQQLIVF